MGGAVMKPLRSFAAMAGMAAVLTSQAAWADNAIYEGDCARAQVVKDENTIDKLMRYSTYKGSQILRFGTSSEATCDSDRVIVQVLKLVSRSSVEAVYSFRRTDIMLGNTPGACRAASLNRDSISGTVRFSTKMQPINGRCEVYVWSDWQSTDTAAPDWKGHFANRIILLNNGSFTVAQGAAPTTGKFFSPIGYTGVM